MTFITTYQGAVNPEFGLFVAEPEKCERRQNMNSHETIFARYDRIHLIRYSCYGRIEISAHAKIRQPNSVDSSSIIKMLDALLERRTSHLGERVQEAEFGPFLHQHDALGEHVTAQIGGLNLVFIPVSEGSFGNIAGEFRACPNPVAER